MAGEAAAGWYPDPGASHELRYWDGASWTEHVADSGVATSDAVAEQSLEGELTSLADSEPGSVPDDLVADVEIVLDDSEEVAPVAAAGWCSDPSGRAARRYHDGFVWSAYVERDGAAVLDPEGVAGIGAHQLPGMWPSPGAGDTRGSRVARKAGRDEARATRDVARCVARAEKEADRSEKKEQRQRVRAAKGELRAAEKRRHGAIAQARRVLDVTEKERSTRIGVARTQLDAALDPDGRRVGSYRGVVLNQRTIHTREGTADVRSASTTVDTAGNLAVTKRPTLTRLAAGGLLLGPLGAAGSLAFQKRKDVDARELYLLIETDRFASVVECPADEGMKARQFGAAVTSAARRATFDEPARQQTIVEQRAIIERATADTSAIDAARAGLLRAEADAEMREAIETAKRQLAELMAAPGADPPALPSSE